MGKGGEGVWRRGGGGDGEGRGVLRWVEVQPGMFSCGVAIRLVVHHDRIAGSDWVKKLLPSVSIWCRQGYASPPPSVHKFTFFTPTFSITKIFSRLFFPSFHSNPRS